MDVADSNISISDLYALVKKYGKDFTPGNTVNPALFNEDGTPKMFYHRTSAESTGIKFVISEFIILL